MERIIELIKKLTPNDYMFEIKSKTFDKLIDESIIMFDWAVEFIRKIFDSFNVVDPDGEIAVKHAQRLVLLLFKPYYVNSDLLDVERCVIKHEIDDYLIDHLPVTAKFVDGSCPILNDLIEYLQQLFVDLSI